MSVTLVLGPGSRCMESGRAKNARGLSVSSACICAKFLDHGGISFVRVGVREWLVCRVANVKKGCI